MNLCFCVFLSIVLLHIHAMVRSIKKKKETLESVYCQLPDDLLMVIWEFLPFADLNMATVLSGRERDLRCMS